MGKIGSHSLIMNPPNPYSSKNAGAITMTSRLDTTSHDVEPLPYLLTADLLGLGRKGGDTIGAYRVLCPFKKS